MYIPVLVYMYIHVHIQSCTYVHVCTCTYVHIELTSTSLHVCIHCQLTVLYMYIYVHFLHDTIEHIVNALCNKCKFQLDVNVLRFNDRYH